LGLKHRSLGLAILLLLLGVTIIGVRLVFAKPFTIATVAEEPYSICVIQMGLQDPNGTIAWLPGYAYPGTPISQCQDETMGGQDVLGRTWVFHQFILGSQNVTTGTTVTGTSTTALTSTSTALVSTSTTTFNSTPTTTLATAEATPNSALAILIVAILAVVVLQKRAKPSGG
jgi:hypothetical protein